MVPAQRNLTIYQYTDFSQSFTWKSGTPPTANNLTGCGVRFMARVNHTDASPLLSLTTTSNAQGILLLQPKDINNNPQIGMITIQINKATTATLLASVTPYYQLFVDFPSGGPSVSIVEGRLLIYPEDVH